MLYPPERMTALRICFYDNPSTAKANAGTFASHRMIFSASFLRAGAWVKTLRLSRRTVELRVAASEGRLVA
jgi:hypothetical protein